MAATSSVKPGIAAKVYRNTGTYGSPTWTAMNLARSVNDNSKWDTADASSREGRARLYAKTQVDLPHDIEMRADNADTGYVAMYAAWASATAVVDLLILDGPITDEGAMGIRAEFIVCGRPQNQGAGDVIYTTFPLMPTWTSNGVPKSVVMGAASAPGFTSF